MLVTLQQSEQRESATDEPGGEFWNWMDGFPRGLPSTCRLPAFAEREPEEARSLSRTPRALNDLEHYFTIETREQAMVRQHHAFGLDCASIRTLVARCTTDGLK